MSGIRLISVTEEGWGSDLPKSLSAMANQLLPDECLEYEYYFTGKQVPRLGSKDTLVFRFQGKLLGEATFLKWSDDEPGCMIYRPVRQYHERVVASNFIPSSANPYPVIDNATIRRIRKIAMKLNPGPYPKTGETESMTDAEQLKSFDAVMDRYYRGDVLEKAKTVVQMFSSSSAIGAMRHVFAKYAINWVSLAFRR
jgi:hypothetical protein